MVHQAIGTSKYLGARASSPATFGKCSFEFLTASLVARRAGTPALPWVFALRAAAKRECSTFDLKLALGLHAK
jgi:hypothetical protein